MAAGLLGLMVATFADVRAACAATTPTLTLTPSHGPSTAQFTIAYQEPARLMIGICPSSVTFTFDGVVLGDAPITRKGSVCVASLSASPTSGSEPGTHTVRAADRSASATYTVDPAPSPTPPSPTPARQAPSPTPSPTRPSAGPSDVSGTQPTGSSAGRTDIDDGPSVAGALVSLPGRAESGGTSATTWVLTGGAAFILVDIAILALLSLRGRRGERRPALPDNPRRDNPPPDNPPTDGALPDGALPES